MDIESFEYEASVEGNGTDEHLSHILLNQALDRLQPDLREMVILRYVSEVAVSDIGRIMGMSRLAVCRRLKEAMSVLKSMMEGGSEK